MGPGQKKGCCGLGLLNLVWKTSVSTILRSCLSNRCVELQTQLACNLVNKELLEYPFLLLDLEKQLLEVQESLTLSGCRKKCVDLKLEHARIKK